MGLMAADLRSACPMDKQLDFLGMHRTLGEAAADNVDFATHNYTPRRAQEGDFCEESFFVDQDPETKQLCLYRRRNPRLSPDPLSGGRREELARGVRGLRLEYYDGLDWYDTWGDAEGRGKPQSSLKPQTNLEGLPEAVRITLWLDTNPQPRKTELEATGEKPPVDAPLVFQTVARLNLAGAVRDSASSANSSPGDNSDQPAANPGNNGGTP
jgi:hypothetical protein